MLEAAFPGGAGRWEVRGTTFRRDGLPHRLPVLSDLSRVLRAEERSAWQRTGSLRLPLALVATADS